MVWRVLIQPNLIRVSKPGIDVFAASSYKDLIFDSDLQTHGVFTSGLATGVALFNWYTYIGSTFPPGVNPNNVGREAYGSVISYSNPRFPHVPHILFQQLRPDGNAEGPHLFGWYILNSNFDFQQKGPSEGFLPYIKANNFALTWFINAPANSGGVLTYPVRYHILYGTLANLPA